MPNANFRPLDFTPDFRSSRMFKNAPEEIIDIFKSKPVTMNNHMYGVGDKEYLGKSTFIGLPCLRPGFAFSLFLQKIHHSLIFSMSSPTTRTEKERSSFLPSKENQFQFMPCNGIQKNLFCTYLILAGAFAFYTIAEFDLLLASGGPERLSNIPLKQLKLSNISLTSLSRNVCYFSTSAAVEILYFEGSI